MENQKGIDKNNDSVFSDRQIIAITTVLFSLGIFEYKYDLIEEYLSPGAIAHNQAEVSKAVKECTEGLDGVLTRLYLEECVEDVFQENTANFREVSCKVNENGEGNCDLAGLF